MGIKYSEDAVKLGFADITNKNQPSGQPFYGYFADAEKTKEERYALLQAKSEEKLCNRIPGAYVDDIRIPSASGPIILNETDCVVAMEDQYLPVVKEMTEPPSMKTDSLINLAILGFSVFFLIKIIDA